MKNINECIYKVNGGDGGDSYLIIGSEKTAVVDTGMAYCADNLIKNIENKLGGKPLDYILASHSHYDHIGAVANLKQRWTNAKVLGAAYAKNVLEKRSALKLIRELSENAKEVFDSDNKYPPFSYDDNLLVIDEEIKEGDKINLGDICVLVLETPGHTKCSLSFFTEEPKVLFSSETLGVILNSGSLIPGFIISFEDAIKAVEKCRKLDPDYIIVPHYGLLSEELSKTFFDNAIKQMIFYKDFVCNAYNNNMEYEQILEALADSVKEDLDANGQPRKAFMLNAAAMVKNVIRVYCEKK